MEPEKFPSVPTPDVESYGGVIPEIYQRLDRVLGRLLLETSPETLVLIASDHGGEANCEEDYRWAEIHTENLIEALKLTGLMTASRIGRKAYLRLRNPLIHRCSDCYRTERTSFRVGLTPTADHPSHGARGKRVYSDLFGGNCKAAAGEFLGRFVEFRPGRSTI